MFGVAVDSTEFSGFHDHATGEQCRLCRLRGLQRLGQAATLFGDVN
jgi:hypothetical protein